MRFQGPSARPLLARSLQRAALEQGVNVSRTDVLFELVGRLGLDTHRFETAWLAAQTRRLVLEEQRLAHARGIRRVPTLVIGGRWMISGLREVAEYRELILACLGKVPRSPGGSPSSPSTSRQDGSAPRPPIGHTAQLNKDRLRTSERAIGNTPPRTREARR